MKKKIFYTTQRDLDGLRWTAKVVDFGVSLMVKAALNELDSAYALLLDNKRICRHEIKRCASLASKAAVRKEEQIMSLMTDKRFFFDYSDSVVDSARNDISLFRLAIKQELDDAKIKESQLFSYLECARVMLDMCDKQYDNIMEEAKTKWGRSYHKEFAEFRVDAVYTLWNRLCQMVYKGHSANLDTQRVQEAFDVMCAKFALGNYIQECLQYAHENNPNVGDNDIKVTQ